MYNTPDSFQTYLETLGYKTRTVQMLTFCLARFTEYHPIPSKQIKKHHILAFKDRLQEQPHPYKPGGLSPRYINHHLYALRTYFNWQEAIGEIETNPVSSLHLYSREENTRQPLSKHDIQKLFKAAHTPKEQTMLHLFYSCGLRVSEAVALNTKDIHFNEKVLYVKQGKGDKRRAIPLTTTIAEELHQYNQIEKPYQPYKKDQEAFITNTKGRRMSKQSYNKTLKALLRKADLPHTTTLHQLRHSIATHLLENGVSLEQVRDFLGHSSLETTMIYTKVNQRQLQKL